MESTRPEPLADITSSLEQLNQQEASSSKNDAYMGDKQVTKRSGETQVLSEGKLRARLERLVEGLATKHIDLSLITTKTVSYAQNGMLTSFSLARYQDDGT